MHRGDFFRTVTGQLRLLLVSVVVSAAMPVMAVCNNTVPQTAATSHFTNNRDGTVTDNTTGLMWSVCIYSRAGYDCSLVYPGMKGFWASDWDAALAELSTLNGSYYLGYNDWRIPDVKELASIIEAQCTAPALNPAVFPPQGAGSVETWTSSPDTTDATLAWVIDLQGNGDAYTADRTLAKPFRLVRDTKPAQAIIPF